jgi:AraC family transcriptional regulator, exoenzyme S synthesis regulatory protein ExsA
MQLDVNNTTQAFFTSIQPYFTQDPPPPQNLLELKLEELLINLLLNPVNAGFLSFIEHIGDDSKYSFVEAMESNYMYNLSLAQFAKLNHISLTVFKKRFSDIFSTTPGKWLLEKRLDLAYRLLVTTSKSIHDVADESGFESITHFSRVFKEKFGMPPLQCRKENAN